MLNLEWRPRTENTTVGVKVSTNMRAGCVVYFLQTVKMQCQFQNKTRFTWEWIIKKKKTVIPQGR